jgi:hypothetical protein
MMGSVITAPFLDSVLASASANDRKNELEGCAG